MVAPRAFTVLLALLSLLFWDTPPTLAPGTMAWAQVPSTPPSSDLSHQPGIAQPPTPSTAAVSDSRPEIAGVPQKVFDVLAEIQARRGQPPPGYVGGRTFENRERRLPKGRYREYDVNPKRPGRNRGPERLVIEQRTGKAFYTDDHYRTFTPIN